MVLDLKGVEYSTNEYKVLIGTPKGLISYTLLRSCTTIQLTAGKTPFYLCANTFTELDAEVDSELTTLDKTCFMNLNSLRIVNFRNCKKLLSISASAFYNDGKLEEIILPPNLKYFGQSSFNGCKSLKTLNIPDSVLKLAMFMIRDTTMQEIHISENSNLETIESESLKSTALTSFFVPKNVTYLDGSMFMFSYQLKDITIHKENKNFVKVGYDIYSADNKTLLLTRNSGEITIPGHVEILAFGCFRGTLITKVNFENNVMKEIGDWFCCETEVTEFTYPKGIANVSAHAFAASQKLTTVVLTEDIKIIDEYAFQYCIALTSIKLLTVEDIRRYAFNQCTNLENISIPASVTKIGAAAFSECNKLTVDCSQNVNFEIKDNMFFKNEKTVLSEYFGTELADIVIPSHCLIIGQSAFASKNIGKVTFQGSLSMEIQFKAFTASTITEIELPSYLSFIGGSCFSGCKHLSSITFNNSPITTIEEACFSSCLELTSIVLPRTIENIKKQAFFNCKKLANFDISSISIKTIGDSAFTLTALTTVEFPSTIESIGIEAFKNTPLASIAFSEPFGSNENCLYEIPDTCFYGCKQLTSVTFSSHISDIKTRAFGECTILETITLPKNITFVRKLAFEGCTSLTTVTLAKDCMLNKVEGTAFANCPKLIKIGVDPDDANFIFENGALMSKLKTKFIFFLPASTIPVYVVPATIEDIGPHAFEGCYNLRMITIPDGIIKKIQYRAFADCRKLEFIYLPVTITEIGAESFVGCNKLKCGSIFTSGSENVNKLLKENGVPPIVYSSYCEGQISSNCKCFGSFKSSLFISLLLFTL